MSSRACSGALACCTGMAQSRGQHTLWGNKIEIDKWLDEGNACSMIKLSVSPEATFANLYILLYHTPWWRYKNSQAQISSLIKVSQRSLHNAPIFRLLLKVAVNGTHQCDFLNFWGTFGSQQVHIIWITSIMQVSKRFSHGTMKSNICWHYSESHVHPHGWKTIEYEDVKITFYDILAEGAIALSVTLSGGALFASWKLLQFPSSLIVKVILAIFSGASAQQSR